MGKYIGPDGKVVEKRSVWRLSIIGDIFAAVYNFFAIFFNAVTNPPQIESRQRSTYAQRHGGRSHRGGGSGRPARGSNIRGCNQLGGASAKMAGG